MLHQNQFSTPSWEIKHYVTLHRANQKQTPSISGGLIWNTMTGSNSRWVVQARIPPWTHSGMHTERACGGARPLWATQQRGRVWTGHGGRTGGAPRTRTSMTQLPVSAIREPGLSFSKIICRTRTSHPNNVENCTQRTLSAFAKRGVNSQSYRQSLAVNQKVN